MLNISISNREFGPEAKNKINFIHDKTINGALAALETFYYSFNKRDLEIQKQVWFTNNLVQLNNPLGGIVRGVDPVIKLYEKIFNSHLDVWVRLSDIVYYATESMVVFAGIETGFFTNANQVIPLSIRTSRVFGYLNGEERWFQLHHHGSIDNADLLSIYQSAINK